MSNFLLRNVSEYEAFKTLVAVLRAGDIASNYLKTFSANFTSPILSGSFCGSCLSIVRLSPAFIPLMDAIPERTGITALVLRRCIL